MKEKQVMEHPMRPAAAGAQAAIAELQQAVQVWMDGDRVLPADGSALLAALERVQEDLDGEDAAAAQAGITAFLGQVQALIAAGRLEIGSAPPLLEARVTGCLAPERPRE